MVPSDPISSPAHRRHASALSFAGKSAGRFASLLPGRRFLRLPDQRFLARRSLALLSSPGPVARNGLSLARNGSRFRGLHSGVNVPGLLLRSLHRNSQARSASRSTAGPGSPRNPAASSRQPVACSLPRSTRHRFGLRSPNGIVPSPRDQCVLPGEWPVSPPCEIARSPFAPRLRVYF